MLHRASSPIEHSQSAFRPVTETELIMGSWRFPLTLVGEHAARYVDQFKSVLSWFGEASWRVLYEDGPKPTRFYLVDDPYWLDHLRSMTTFKVSPAAGVYWGDSHALSICLITHQRPAKLPQPEGAQEFWQKVPGSEFKRLLPTIQEDFISNICQTSAHEIAHALNHRLFGSFEPALEYWMPFSFVNRVMHFIRYRRTVLHLTGQIPFSNYAMISGPQIVWDDYWQERGGEDVLGGRWGEFRRQLTQPRVLADFARFDPLKGMMPVFFRVSQAQKRYLHDRWVREFIAEALACYATQENYLFLNEPAVGLFARALHQHLLRGVPLTEQNLLELTDFLPMRIS